MKIKLAELINHVSTKYFKNANLEIFISFPHIHTDRFYDARRSIADKRLYVANHYDEYCYNTKQLNIKISENRDKYIVIHAYDIHPLDKEMYKLMQIYHTGVNGEPFLFMINDKKFLEDENNYQKFIDLVEIDTEKIDAHSPNLEFKNSELKHVYTRPKKR